MSSKKSVKVENKTTAQSSSKPRTKSFFIYGLLSASTITLLAWWMSLPPDLPKVDLDAWWGPYPIDQKPDFSIRPFKIEFTDVMINDLRERLLHTRPFTPPLEDIGFQYGFNTNFLNQILDYWKNKYNFKERERFLNKYEQFVTKIQGLDIHYLHVKPKSYPDNVKVVPLLMIHGWPGSVREFYEIIPKLTTYREGQEFVFEVIAPSLPGYGFSQAAVRPGLGSVEVSVVMHNLMKRIGYEKYYIQGGDWGHVIGSNMATLFPNNILGFHTNCPILVLNHWSSLYVLLGSLFPSLLVPKELQYRLYPLRDHAARSLEETGYMHIQATKPDTIGAALSDSPAGLAAYILEKFSTWTNTEYKKARDGNLLHKYTLTTLLDNVMIYWVTNTITTSMRLYSEQFTKNQLAMKMDLIPTDVPTWGIKFKYEILFQPDLALRMKFKNYLHSTVIEDGGHFAAMENPDILATDIYDAVERFREFHSEGSKPATKQGDYETAKTIYEFTVRDIKGKEVKLEKYRGHVAIIVNVASQCGLTETNYHQLNELYEKYGQSRGLRILAFPCNQFNQQEPGTLQEILQFAKTKGVQFDLFEKIEVNGDNAHPLWKFLKRTQSGTLGDFIKWNFSKFIVNKEGVPVERLGPTVNPLDLEPYLIKYW